MFPSAFSRKNLLLPILRVCTAEYERMAVIVVDAIPWSPWKRHRSANLIVSVDNEHVVPNRQTRSHLLPQQMRVPTAM
jgi:hypothetical protein